MAEEPDIEVLDKDEVEMDTTLKSLGLGSFSKILREQKEILKMQKEKMRRTSDCPECNGIGTLVPCRLRCRNCGYETEKVKKVEK